MSERLNTSTNNTISKNIALAYAAFGAFVAAILDTASNTPSSCDKFGEALAKVFSISNIGVIDTIGVLFVITIAAVLARIEQFKTEKGAIMSGLMIFSTIALLTPFNSERGYTSANNDIINNPVIKQSVTISGGQKDYSTSISTAVLFNVVSPTAFNSNASIRARILNVSSCRPSQYGFLGLGSLINNNLRTCPIGHVLKKGTRVEILQTWKANTKGHWYAKINYRINSRVHSGWVQAGSKKTPWAFLRRDRPI